MSARQIIGRFGTFCLVCFCIFASVASAAEKDCVLTSWAGEEPPYLYTDSLSGEVSGPDADILRSAAAVVGCEVRFVPLPWKRALLHLKTGELDIVPFARLTNERKEYSYFSVPYRQFAHRLFVATNSPFTGDSLHELLKSGGRVAVMKAYKYPDKVEFIRTDPAYADQFVEVSTYEQLLMLLEKKRIDGIIASREVVETRCPKLGLDSDGFAEGEEFSEPLHFLFSKMSVPEHWMRDMNVALQIVLDAGDQDEVY